ncbi:zinc ribbon domain-containing protein [Candidatus Nitrososphaera gargensis]|uniref:zinc ribbon domain-containing protein n=1 Tax=Candidatus Nitrososphaera gargensis TaxID=497727 RepID=UPI00389920F2
MHCLQRRKARRTSYSCQSKWYSQKCSRCGTVAKEKLDLDERIFECHSCGLVIDRDWNAAINILKLGLEQAYAEKQQSASTCQTDKQVCFEEV